MNPKDLVARQLMMLHENLYKVSGGRVGGRLAGMPVLLLTTVGRRTGRRRTTPLTYTTHGDNLVLVASYGGDDRHPTWYLNLTTNPSVEVQQGSEVGRFSARTATAQEKERLWPAIVAIYGGYAAYQRKTEREIPLVILEPHPSAGVDGQ